MYRIMPSFPSGIPGAGLLLLRLAVAVYLTIGDGAPSCAAMTHGLLDTAASVASIVCAALTAAGFLTPLVQMVTASAGVAMLAGVAWLDGIVSLAAGAPVAGMLAIAVSVSLAMLGPGSYSIDAYWFGRHEVIIPPRVPQQPLPLSWYAKRPQT